MRAQSPGAARNIAAGVLAALAFTGLAAAEASAATYVQSSMNELRVKPKRITAGAALVLTRIHWRGWGGRTATARNVRYTNNGYAGRNTIRVSRRITCRGHRLYSRLTILGKGSPGPITVTCRQISDARFRHR